VKSPKRIANSNRIKTIDRVFHICRLWLATINVFQVKAPAIKTLYKKAAYLKAIGKTELFKTKDISYKKKLMKVFSGYTN
jgi:hypothetical protein